VPILVGLAVLGLLALFLASRLLAPPAQAPRVATDGMTLLYVPAGEFTMGSGDASSNEKQHTVYLDAFWIDQTEVTNAMFQKFVKATNYQTDAEKQGSGNVFDTTAITFTSWSDTQGADWQLPRGPNPNSNLNGLADHPVVQVSWNDATAYCKWAGGDLPTEAQWEKAARGDDGRTYPWGDQAPDASRLNFNQNVGDTTAVGKYPTGASFYGALDMAGNVCEWVRDWYNEKYYASAPAPNPDNTTKSVYRVVRGGGWVNEAAFVRASDRSADGPGDRNDVIGFRCAR